jgi:dTDP-4-dehydrorhamnose 3,5-epimerase
MDLPQSAISGLLLIEPRRHEDARGFFVETYSRRALAALGVDVEFVQDNLSFSRQPGTVRGLHFQRPPFAQAKLVQVLRGAILDVAVDVRRGSPTFGEHFAAALSADTGRQLFIPEGFLHGFASLEPDTLVSYKASAPYAPDCDGAVLWCDPRLAIAWPVDPRAAIVSAKDAAAPPFADFDSPFTFTADGRPA